ncbi:MAG: DUF4388 domain-containing protein [bacterium]|nr:DUF4388 domain-containing protein [bacterium]
MNAPTFPAAAANSLVSGYCDDFVSFANGLAQTLEQVSMRQLDIGDAVDRLAQLERGMRDLADAVADMLGGVAAPVAPAPATGPLSIDEPPAPQPQRMARPAVNVAPTAARPPAPARPATAAPRVARPGESEDQADGSTLRGTNSSMPLVSVAQFLGRMRKSGVLHVDVDGEELRFEFVNGILQRTASSRCPREERLGELLVELGFCSHEQVDALPQPPGGGGRPIGDLVLEAGIVTHGQLLEALEQQVQRRFGRASRNPSASYRFVDKQCAPTDGRVRLTSGELAFRARRGPA